MNTSIDTELTYNEKRDERKKNPNWDEVELILTLNLYHQNFPKVSDISSNEINELSNLLIEYHKLLGNEITDTLRNTNGVLMKLRNFESLDERIERKGLNSVSNLDREIWEKYKYSKEILLNYSSFIKVNIKNKMIENLKLFTDDSYSEKQILKIIEKQTAINTIGTNLSEKVIFDKHIKPVLNIKNVAKVFSKYIIKYNAEYTSTIIGIFAKWGRGKTFFYDVLKNDIKKENENIYFCEFQPWKYQKQESTWAYLYEKILNNYLENDKKYKNKLCSFFKNLKTIKIIKLNFNRVGKLDFIKWISILVVSFLSIVFSSELDIAKDKIYAIIIAGYGGLALFFYNSYKFYLGNKRTVLNLIEKYGKTKDFSNQLGFQNEIEKELKYVINTYITKDEERLILFIDDLDRCDEKMIINIMDSLRLVLEDQEINKKLIIITAIDERILLKSIKHKYYNKENEMEYFSPEEYIEKFFLIALKLNHIDDKDKIELVDEYSSIFNQSPSISAIVKMQNNKKLDETEKAFVKEEKLAELVKDKDIEVKGNSININNTIGQEEIDIKSIEPKENDFEVLNNDEIDFIKKSIIEYYIDTPRKINMMIQRYLLFKNFIFEELGYNSSNYKLYISLIFYALEKNNIKKLIEEHSNVKDNEEITFEINGNKFTENIDNFIILLKYAEMVTPF